MAKLLPFFFLFLISQQLFTQEERIKIYGTIHINEENASDIHIINKSTNKGTITNANGYFQIPVRKGDTLIFSGIQFYYKELVINKKHIDDKKLHIKLVEKNNKLEEVTVKNHTLKGNLYIDSRDSEDNLIFYNEDMLGLENLDLSTPVIMDIDSFSRSRSSSDPVIPSGINILGLLRFVSEPFIEDISKIGETKRNLRAYKTRRKEKAKKAPENIRNEFGDNFFVKTLKIPANKIDQFIAYCQTKGIVDLYLDDKKIEMIDLMLKYKKDYLEQIE